MNRSSRSLTIALAMLLVGALHASAHPEIKTRGAHNLEIRWR